MGGLDHSQFRKQAKKNFNPKFCWVCRECDGLNCASSVPGMGGVNKMLTFQENIRVLQNIKILPQYINEFKKAFRSNDNLAKKDFNQIEIGLSILNIPTRAPVLTASYYWKYHKYGSQHLRMGLCLRKRVSSKNVRANTYLRRWGKLRQIFDRP